MSSVLTPRLRACLVLARDGLTAIQIGNALGLSYRTVNQYLSEAYKRLGARNRAQAVSIAIQTGEIPVAGPRGLEDGDPDTPSL
ncbi:response regulator containing a CheY-like receiver domain and an HTH DNA-binding domain [Caulobacter sp. AP07]|uniref:helix-turn-helix domain-containing protein n=1 Tax=Caulobacter sp. AP07 TaxID=1144304 RepID=UPI00027224CB|nr:helix-turn-helix transcriptional regulator [Caulobacter sp. AP07]EJL37867.1 response regulator containing a CheY-like receiver domain and an HTH DNA-binding domain [Caulobacter sp. AP07]